MIFSFVPIFFVCRLAILYFSFGLPFLLSMWFGFSFLPSLVGVCEKASLPVLCDELALVLGGYRACIDSTLLSH